MVIKNCLLMSILLKEVTAHLTALDSFPHLCPLSLCVNSFPHDLVSTISLLAFRCFLTQYTTCGLGLARELQKSPLEP